MRGLVGTRGRRSALPSRGRVGAAAARARKRLRGTPVAGAGAAAGIAKVRLGAGGRGGEAQYRLRDSVQEFCDAGMHDGWVPLPLG